MQLLPAPGQVLQRLDRRRGNQQRLHECHRGAVAAFPSKGARPRRGRQRLLRFDVKDPAVGRAHIEDRNSPLDPGLLLDEFARERHRIVDRTVAGERCVKPFRHRDRGIVGDRKLHRHHGGQPPRLHQPYRRIAEAIADIDPGALAAIEHDQPHAAPRSRQHHRKVGGELLHWLAVFVNHDDEAAAPAPGKASSTPPCPMKWKMCHSPSRSFFIRSFPVPPGPTGNRPCLHAGAHRCPC